MKIITLLLFAVWYCHAENCLKKSYGSNSIVCVCNSNHCDTLPRPDKLSPQEYMVYTSNQAGLRFDKQTYKFATNSSTAHFQITISTAKKYQSIVGFGGAFTDATGINIGSLDEMVQDKLMEAYFSETGIEYSLCRVPIGGTDFSTHGYSYDDGDVDQNLTNFSLAEEDFKYKIPFIKKAQNLTNLELFASAWAAPLWMKTNNEYAGLGFLKKEMYQTWANYFVKFLDEYQKEGLNFWGITTGNEPLTAFVPANKIPIVGWTDSEMGIWVENNLGPALRNSKHSDIKLMIFDDQRLSLPGFVNQACLDTNASVYVDGIAFHWYTNWFISPDRLDETHQQFPDKFILSTEACIDLTLRNGEGPVALGSWTRGEDYGTDMLTDLQHWTAGWIDWNMALDPTGGPTYISNFVDAPIIVNKTSNEFYKQPMYYFLGHFSKFLPKGSVRIDSINNLGKDLLVVALQKPDNGTVLILLNKREEPVTVTVNTQNGNVATLQLSDHSISTVLYW